jgi:hypothetical protein
MPLACLHLDATLRINSRQHLPDSSALNCTSFLSCSTSLFNPLSQPLPLNPHSKHGPHHDLQLLPWTAHPGLQPLRTADSIANACPCSAQNVNLMLTFTAPTKDKLSTLQNLVAWLAPTYGHQRLLNLALYVTGRSSPCALCRGRKRRTKLPSRTLGASHSGPRKMRLSSNA